MMVPNHLRACLDERQFFCSAELVLDRDHSVPEAESFVRAAASDENGVRIISLTDLPGGNPALPPEAFVSFILENGLTPLAHLTGKDGNRSFVEGRLHSLARLGVENILALTGDAQKPGYQGKAKPVFDLDSVLIIWLIQALRNGLSYSIGRRELRSTPFNYLVGAVASSYKIREPDQMMQLYKLELKIAAGAQFIITQLGYNLRKLYELIQYMERVGLKNVPVVANIYVPTATVAKMMKAGEVSGCIIPEELMKRLEKEKKPERLERAALTLAAVKELGFAGAHIGGFGLSHSDFRTIIDRAESLGPDWRNRLDELIFETPGEFYLFPMGSDGFSDGSADFQVTATHPHQSFTQALSRGVHDLLIKPDSLGARFFESRLGRGSDTPVTDTAKGGGFWARILGLSSLYRKATLGCVSCGDCIQDHASYAGCTMRWCYKNLRNGPCGGSRPDGTCEVDVTLPCIWNLVYLSTLAAGEDPRKFAQILIPPRDWCLDRTNALANRLSGLDNYCRRQKLEPRLAAPDETAPRES